MWGFPKAKVEKDECSVIVCHLDAIVVKWIDGVPWPLCATHDGAGWKP